MVLWEIAKEGIGLIILIFFWIPFIGLGSLLLAVLIMSLTGIPAEFGAVLFLIFWVGGVANLFVKHRKKKVDKYGRNNSEQWCQKSWKACYSVRKEI